MIAFGYLKLMFDIGNAFICYDCRLWMCARFYHAFLIRCFDNTVLLQQSAYRNREVFLGRYCDVSSYNNRENLILNYFVHNLADMGLTLFSAVIGIAHGQELQYLFGFPFINSTYKELFGVYPRQEYDMDFTDRNISHYFISLITNFTSSG